jgi:hypothetical protein
MSHIPPEDSYLMLYKLDNTKYTQSTYTTSKHFIPDTYVSVKFVPDELLKKSQDFEFIPTKMVLSKESHLLSLETQ